MVLMAKKPLYSKFITSAEFNTKSEADTWAKKQKTGYKAANMSVKFDITRTPNSGWKVSFFGKV
jgi:hypothetical protein